MVIVVCHSCLSGIFLKNQKDCGQAAMTESDKDVVSVITLLVKGFPIRLRLRSEREAMNSEEYLFYWIQ
ncbi:MAG: hypothetical protein A2Y81_04135 [Nitrospirae bacterium RBG_13_43_8]|nr:MAG: hypothetical protein A2Y81_04135 [Nitrospirae bacterium RBG_13_43_8]